MTNLDVLVLDDDRLSAETLADQAFSLGFSSQLTTNAVAFKNVFQSSHPKIVIIDLIMPDADGIEISQWVAHLRRSVNIILVSGYNPQDYLIVAKKLIECYALETVQTLQKPITLGLLKGALDRFH